jgi:hypothetical protein
MNNFFRLAIYLTIKSPDGKDVLMQTSRTIPFQPVEGLTMLLPILDDQDPDLEQEYGITLSAPTYSYLESSFIETLEDDNVGDLIRNGEVPSNALDAIVKYYEAYGFTKVKPNGR